MSISTEITKLNTNLTASYTACSNKGATLPASQNFDNLASTISAIPTATEPTLASLTVTPSTTAQTLTPPSGTDGYNTVTVSAVTASIDSDIQAGNIKSGVTILGVTGNYTGSGGGGITRDVSAQGVYQKPTSSFTWSLPSNATDVGTQALYYAFVDCTGLTGALDLSSLTTVSGSNAFTAAFYNCTGLTGVLDLSSLTTLSGTNAMYQAFYNCTGLTSVDLSSLTTISGQSALNRTFYNCTGLTGVLDLSSLTTISNSNTPVQNAFYNCTGLTSVDLSSLTTVSTTTSMSQFFYNCSGLTNVNLNNLQIIGINASSTSYGHFYGCFYGCTNLTSITFPKLKKIYCTGGTSTSYGTFANNNKVQKMYFPKLDTITYGSGASTSNQNACKNVFYGCTSLTELHFAAAYQSAIQATAGYSTAWGRGAGNVTIYFDL